MMLRQDSSNNTGEIDELNAKTVISKEKHAQFHHQKTIIKAKLLLNLKSLQILLERNMDESGSKKNQHINLTNIGSKYKRRYYNLNLIWPVKTNI